MILDVFVPGRLRNPLNGSWGHWSAHARDVKDWRTRTGQHILVELLSRRMPREFHHWPKRVTLTVRHRRLWDDDNLAAGLQAALKGVRDEVARTCCPDGDGPRARTTWHYGQEKWRGIPGVRIRIEAVDPEAGHG